MSNIHQLADYEEGGEETPLIVENERRSRTATLMSFLDVLFPFCTWKSSLFCISLIQVSVYIATLAVGSIAPLVPSNETLYMFQANFPPAIQLGHIQRLICPIFLHANFGHLFFNMLFQLRIGFGIERRYGWKLFTLIYMVCGILGNIFSATIMFCGSLKVGASTAGYGLIGLTIAELAMAWQAVRNKDRVIVNLTLFVLTTSLLALSINGGQIDLIGHAGGFLSGAALGVIVGGESEMKPNWYAVARLGAYSILVCMAGVCLPVLFAVKREC